MKISMRFRETVDYLRIFTRDKFSLYLLTILVAGAILRFYGIGTEDLWLDETRTVWFGSKGYDFLTAVKRISTDLQGPLYFAGIHFWLYFVEISETTIRIPSAVFGILSIIYVYKFSAENFSKNAGMFSAIILAFSPISIEFSQEARTYSLTVLLSVISFYYFVKLLKNKNKTNAFFYIMSSVLLIHSHYYAGLILIAQNLYILGFFKSKIFNFGIWFWTKINLIIFLLLIPVSIFLLKFQIQRQSLERGNQENILNVLQYLSGTKILMIAMVALSLLYLGSTIYNTYLYKHKSDKQNTIGSYLKENYVLLVLLFWLLIPLLLPVIIGELYKPTYSRRYFLVSSIPLFILTALGIDRLNFRPLKFIALAALILLGTVKIWTSYGEFQKPRWKEATEFIDSSYKDGDLVLIYPSFYINPYNYYAKDGYNPKRFRYFRQNRTQEQIRLFQRNYSIPEGEKEKILLSKRIWLVLKKEDIKSNMVRSFLSENFKLELERSFSQNSYNYAMIFLYSSDINNTYH